MELLLTILSLILSIVAIVKISRLESQVRNNSSLQPTTYDNIHAQNNSSKKMYDIIVQQDGKEGLIMQLARWYMYEWPFKTGALFILIGCVWFVTYAFLHNWIGAQGRIAIGVIAGLILIFLGDRRIKVISTQGVTVVGLGAGIMMLSLYAGQNYYSPQIFSNTTAYVLLTILLMYVSIISLRHYIRSLSIFTLLLAGLSPLLIGSHESHIFNLYTYLFIVSTAVLWLVRYSKWRILTILSLWIVVLYSVSFFIGFYTQLLGQYSPSDVLTLQFFAVAFSSFYFLTNLFTFIAGEYGVIEYQSTVVTAIFILGWIHGVVPAAYQSIVASSGAISYLLGSAFVMRLKNDQKPMFAFATAAIVMLTAASMYAFQGPVLTVVVAVQACVVILMAIHYFKEDLSIFFTLYHVVPFFLSLVVFDSPDWTNGKWISAAISLGAITVSFLVTGVMTYRFAIRNSLRQWRSVSMFLLIVGGVYALAWIWSVSHASLPAHSIGHVVTLILYALIGAAIYVYGDLSGRKVTYRFGMAILIFLVIRLLLVEIWEMELVMKIVTFIATGILFMISVLLRSKRNLIHA